ncbi:carbonic anhydrase 4a [Brienomyrus brachyistius]|uniref:carbonic anhydrase 4a n=1 Tax=Brienomyrus brachyistius TaxID=42636 RepID=UPI0020B3A6DE|nr:carbonic anhydrase 4a [Brienomyrus brachyistius]
MKAHFFSLLLASFLKSRTDAAWCYNSQMSCTSNCTGPEFWSNMSNSECNGQSQSPINIVTRKTELDKDLTPIHLTEYQGSYLWNIRNNGKSVQVNIPHGPLISGGKLKTFYRAVQFHLHWGKDGSPGSEHTVDGEQYPMELHIVHIKKQYTTLSEAQKDPTGLAVLGFFYEMSVNNNRNYDPITSALKNIIEAGANATIPNMTLTSIIPPQETLTKYFRYQGSLTTPNCAESVVWTVFESTIPISMSQLSEFSKLKFQDGNPLAYNYRSVQPLNSRKVYRSGCDVVLASITLLAATVLVSITLSQSG